MNCLPQPLFVTSANRKRRWKVYVQSNRILTAVELFLEKNVGEWKPFAMQQDEEGAQYRH
jgi:hypothetical protein